MPDRNTSEVVCAAIEDINKAHNVAVAAVEAAPDRDTALAAAKALANHTQALAKSDDELWLRLVARDWDAAQAKAAEVNENPAV